MSEGAEWVKGKGKGPGVSVVEGGSERREA